MYSTARLADATFAAARALATDAARRAVPSKYTNEVGARLHKNLYIYFGVGHSRTHVY
jgi:hypothetical protein